MANPAQPEQRIAHDGKHRHFWVETLANPEAPTVTELTGGFDFSRYVPKNGVTGEPTQNYVDSGDITQTFDSQQVGTWGEQPTIEMFKQFPDDDAFEFWAHGDKGYWVNLWAADGDSPQDGDVAYVRHVECHQPVPLPQTTNEKQRFRLGLANLDTPIYDAVVTSS